MDAGWATVVTNDLCMCESATGVTILVVDMGTPPSVPLPVLIHVLATNPTAAPTVEYLPDPYGLLGTYSVGNLGSARMIAPDYQIILARSPATTPTGPTWTSELANCSSPTTTPTATGTAPQMSLAPARSPATSRG